MSELKRFKIRGEFRGLLAEWNLRKYEVALQCNAKGVIWDVQTELKGVYPVNEPKVVEWVSTYKFTAEQEIYANTEGEAMRLSEVPKIRLGTQQAFMCGEVKTV